MWEKVFRVHASEITDSEHVVLFATSHRPGSRRLIRMRCSGKDHSDPKINSADDETRERICACIYISVEGIFEDIEMRAVCQRVSRATVAVDGKVVGSIGPGLLVLVAAAKGDNAEQVRLDG